MRRLSRRDVLKSSMAVPPQPLWDPAIGGAAQSGPAPTSAGAPSLRERLLLDFGWRFHFGHANDATKDFGFGSRPVGRVPEDRRASCRRATWPSTTAIGRPVDLPHDWAIELPFKNDPALASKGFYPLGRDYPETSVGWYRRVFELPGLRRRPADLGRVRRRLPGHAWSSSTATTSAGTAAATTRSAST